MTGIVGGGSGGGGFDYVQAPAPAEPEEGESWYDTDANAAFVYTGTEWVEQTVVSHDQLSNVSANDHHSPPTQTAVESSGSGYFSTPATFPNDGSSSTWTIGKVSDSCRITANNPEDSQETYDYTIHLAESSDRSGSITVPAGGSDTVYESFPAQGVTSITASNPNYQSYPSGNFELSFVVVAAHNHTI
ncbi:hypothetical protein [Salarchaeum japonicum]|uniref:DUF2510 domain-containing protein n=1 Tax=Salarchaeum japonicum TaxID=555573 RepID=A0AAV3SYU6_9EURY|nr:hypothetical protein [Salarchaeum japonicum]